MPKLTKRTIDATEPQETEFFIWDEGSPSEAETDSKVRYWNAS